MIEQDLSGQIVRDGQDSFASGGQADIYKGILIKKGQQIPVSFRGQDYEVSATYDSFHYQVALKVFRTRGRVDDPDIIETTQKVMFISNNQYNISKT